MSFEIILQMLRILLYFNTLNLPFCLNCMSTHPKFCSTLYITYTSPYAGGVQVGSPEPPFKINDIHSMHVVEVLAYLLV